MSELEFPDLIKLLMAMKEARIDELGGVEIWDKLSLEERLQYDKEMMLSLTQELGAQEYGKLTDLEKWKFDLFLWGGCCMHKDLNMVKGRDKGIGEFWKSKGLMLPILLANKDNAAVLASASIGGECTAAEICAEKVSGHGGVKTTMLSGLLFHHKDDKKGHSHGSSGRNWVMTWLILG